MTTQSGVTLYAGVSPIAGLTFNAGMTLTAGVSGSAGSSPPVPSFHAGAGVATKVNGFAGGTITFTGLNGGVDFPIGAVVVVGLYTDQSGPATTPQIGGQAATLVTGSMNGSSKNAMYYVSLAAAAPDTFSVANGNFFDNIGVVSAYMLAVTATPADGNTESFGANDNPQVLDAPVVVPTGGFGIVVVGGSIPDAITPPDALTWTNCASAGGDVTSILAAGPFCQLGLAHTTTAGSWNPTVSDAQGFYPFAAGMSAGAWGP